MNRRTGCVNRRILWLVPFVVGLAVYHLSEQRLIETMAAGIGILVFAAVVRRPVVALISLIVFLPLEQVGLALLYAYALPATAARAAGFWKELMAAAVLASATWAVYRSRRRLDGVDRAVLVYLAVVTLFLLLPHLLTPGAPSSLHVRLLAWRADCGYALVFLAARHAPVPARARQVFVKTLTLMGAVLIAFAFYQRVDPYGFEHLVIDTAKVPNYLVSILHEPAAQVPGSIQYVVPTGLRRATSLLLSPFDLGDYMILVIAFLAQKVSRADKSAWTLAVLLGALAVTYLTKVRADLLVALAVVALSVLPSPAKTARGRATLVVAVGLAIVVALPNLTGSRLLGGQSAVSSNRDHVTELSRAISTIEHAPLGLGLGYQPATVSRFQLLSGQGVNIASGISEIQVINELGIEGLLPWLAMFATLLVELRRRRSDPDPFVSGAGIALLALLVAAQGHPVFSAYPAPWTLMAAVGLALNGPRPKRAAPVASREDALPDPVGQLQVQA